jgi:hypothetical protein
MKRVMPFALATATLCAAMSTAVWAEDLPPGQVDFGGFSPPKGGGEFVEVNVPSSLISLGARLVEKDDPDVARLLNGLKLVRVNVIGLDEENRAELQKRAQKVRKDLSGKGWERIVTVQQKDQDVGIYLKMADKGTVQGLVAVVMDGKEHAVFANIVGDIKPEQVSLLGEKLHIDPLKQIGRAEEKAPEEPKEKTPKAEEEK